jgi:hypothetical protein
LPQPRKNLGLAVSHQSQKGSSHVARLVYFGPDRCNRLSVLRSAGYSVDYCATIPTLCSALTNEPDAVVVACATDAAAAKAVHEIHNSTQAPLILFQTSWSGCNESSFDLVILPQTAPASWLEDILNLIEDSPQVRPRPRSADASSLGEE